MISFTLFILLFRTGKSNGDCPITGATLSLGKGEHEFRNLNALRVRLLGYSAGGKPTSVQWTYNGYNIHSTLNTVRSYFFVGEIQENTIGECSSGNHTLYLDIIGKGRTGVYQYSVTNDHTKGRVFSPEFTLIESGPPIDLNVRQIDNDAVEISWIAPANPVEDYRVFINTRRVNKNGIIVNSLKYVIESYDKDTISVRVRATSKHYWSTIAGPKTIRIVRILKPEYITFHSNATSVQIQFVQPTGSLQADKYFVNLTRNTCGVKERNQVFYGSMAHFSDLEEAAVFTVEVTAHNSNYDFQSPKLSFEFNTERAPPDGSPSKPTVSEITATSLLLGWDKIPCLKQNGDVYNYLIMYLDGNQEKTLVTGNASTWVRMTDLHPNTYYAFSVSGINRMGVGPSSQFSHNVKTLYGKPPYPVRNLKAHTTLTSMAVAWLEPVKSTVILDKYNIVVVIGLKKRIAVETVKTEHYLSNIPPNSSISVEVTPHSKVGGGPPTTVEVRTEAISTLRSVLARLTSTRTVLVSWSFHKRRSEITNYLVQYALTKHNKDKNGTKNEHQPLTGSVYSISVKELHNSALLTNFSRSGTYVFSVMPQVKINETVYDGIPIRSNTVSVTLASHTFINKISTVELSLVSLLSLLF